MTQTHTAATERFSRQDTCYTKQTEVLQALDALKRRVLAHGAPAAGAGYHWGYIGDLDAILYHLQHPGLASFETN